MAEISVIMPVYNKAEYLAHGIQSIRDQSFRDFELLIINDGSTDNSLSVIREYAEKDPRIVVFDVPNGGVSKARNIGLDNARGKWIQFLDADDILEPAYLEQAIGILSEEPADILFSGFTMVDPTGNCLREVSVGESGMKNQQELCHCFIQHQYETGFFGYISNKLFSRALLDASGARFPVGTKLAEDLDFYARLYPFVKRARFWEGKSFRYLQTEENYRNNEDIDYRSQLRIQLDIRDWFEKSGLYLMYRAVLDRKISEYVGFVFFYDNEAGKDLRQTVQELGEMPEVMRSVNPKLVSGYSRFVLTCLQKNCPTGIRIYFAARNAIRCVYRKLK